MDAEGLRRELVVRGLDVLEVGRHHRNQQVLVVYLGGGGAWDAAGARHVIGCVPGVLAVCESLSESGVLLTLTRP